MSSGIYSPSASSRITKMFSKVQFLDLEIAFYSKFRYDEVHEV